MPLKDILLLELIKINSRNAKTFLFLHLVFLLLLLLISFIVRIDITHGNESPEVAVFSQNPIKNFALFLDSFSFLPIVILSLFLMQSVGKEFDNGIFKKHAIDGMSLKDIFVGKAISLIIFAITSAFFSFLFSIILGMVFKENAVLDFLTMQYLTAVGLYFLKTLFLLTISLFLIVLSKSTAMSITILIGYIVIEKILMEVLNRYDMLTITAYFPYQSLSGYFNLHTNLSFMVMLLYLNAFLIASWGLFNKERI